MSWRRVLLLVLFGIIMLFPGSVWANIRAQDFRTNGAGPFSGWYWLRRSGHYGEWLWGPSSIATKTAHIYFSLLVTNRIDGGSGYSCKARVSIFNPMNQLIRTKTVSLRNKSPRSSGNSGGVGYQTSGKMKLPNPVRLVRDGFRIKITWPSWNNFYHIGVQQGKAVLVIDGAPTTGR